MAGRADKGIILTTGTFTADARGEAAVVDVVGGRGPESNLEFFEHVEQLLDGGGLPTKARIDALHVAVATVHGMQYLLTWNCVHIANATRRGTIETICRTAGFEPPIICTPFELGLGKE